MIIGERPSGADTSLSQVGWEWQRLHNNVPKQTRQQSGAHLGGRHQDVAATPRIRSAVLQLEPAGASQAWDDLGSGAMIDGFMMSCRERLLIPSPALIGLV